MGGGLRVSYKYYTDVNRSSNNDIDHINTDDRCCLSCLDVNLIDWGDVIDEIMHKSIMIHKSQN